MIGAGILNLFGIWLSADKNARQNAEHGLDTGTWGFPGVRTNNADAYEKVQPGTIVLFGHGLQHPANANPRKSAAEWASASVQRVFLARAVSRMEIASAPHWPDEHKIGDVVYDHRFAFIRLADASNVRLLDRPNVTEALRLSAINQGEGTLVTLSETELDDLKSEFGITTTEMDYRDSSSLGSAALDRPATASKAAPRMNNPTLRKAIEKHAVQTAIEHYTGVGYTKIEELGKPFDLLCKGPGLPELRVEVKGTTGAAAKVIVTRNEIANARDPKNLTDLFIVRDVSVDHHYETATGGEFQIWPDWKAEPERLKATQYEYEVKHEHKWTRKPD